LQTIGKYDVLDVIGYGGMGVVYRARDAAIGRQVALKLMSTAVAQQTELRERFLREARAAGNLQHPNIVVIYDLGEHQGAPYIAMELLSGQPLDRAVQSLSVAQKLAVFTQICDGLQFAHENGVVHRDVKPANVIVLADGRAKLVDFGIARTSDAKLTKTGMVVGTVAYMAPEQLRGKGIDNRTDVFSAGVMLYEMLAGRLPFDGESTAEMMMKILQEEPDELRISGVISPEALAVVVRKALEKEPARRYQSARDFGRAVLDYQRAQDLGVAATAVRPQAQPVTRAAAAATPAAAARAAAAPPPRVAADSPARKMKPALVVVLLVLLAFGGIYGWMKYRPAQAADQRGPDVVPSTRVSVQLLLVATPEDTNVHVHRLKGTDTLTPFKLPPIADESDIAKALVASDLAGRSEVMLTFNPQGAAKLREASSQNIGRRMGVVVAGELVMVATIQTELSDAVSITGLTAAEADELAKRINGEAPAQASSPAPDAARIQQLLSQAKQARDAGKYDEAITHYNQVLSLDSSNADAKAGLAAAQKGKQDERDLGVQ